MEGGCRAEDIGEHQPSHHRRNGTLSARVLVTAMEAFKVISGLLLLGLLHFKHMDLLHFLII